MPEQVVIDKDVLGWGDEHEKELLEKYSAILQVGKHPDLPQRSFDQAIAAYCRDHVCDLITGDARSYTHFFEAGVKKVSVERVGRMEKGDKFVYVVRIVG